MDFEIIGDLRHIETFATNSGIRELARLQKSYGKARWRKRKAEADIKLGDSSIVRAELHWYETTSVGKFEFKIKRILG